jgi:hypothetical protein
MILNFKWPFFKIISYRGYKKWSQRSPIFKILILWSDLRSLIFWPLQLARRHGVFGYPKQSATVSVGSVLKWRARSWRHAVNWAEHVVDEHHMRILWDNLSGCFEQKSYLDLLEWIGAECENAFPAVLSVQPDLSCLARGAGGGGGMGR